MSNIWDYMKKSTKAPVATAIERQADGRFVFRWEDGKATSASARDLRAGCCCAGCVDENTGVRTLDVAGIAPDIAVKSMTPIGNYAVQIAFSDGHDTGIFDWGLLRRIGAPV